MVENIYEVKNKILEKIHKDIQERGVERIDVAEMGMLVDMVKDLAEAEEACWEADYYRAVTDAMDGDYGYSPIQGGQSDSRMASGARSGWSNQYGSGRSRRGYPMSGFHGPAESFKMEMQSVSPQERERMAHELREMGLV